MTNHPTQYSMSFHPKVIDKPKPKSVNLATRWVSKSVTQDEMIELIMSGCAFAPQYKGGYRAKTNFERVSFLAADFDGTMRLEDALNSEFVRAFASFIYTTHSHTESAHRFRPVFLCDEIADRKTWSNAQLGLAHRLGSDRSVSDGARLFYGNRSAKIIRINKTVPADVVSELSILGADVLAARAPTGESLPVVSSRRIACTEMIKTDTGARFRLNELTRKTRVHCPNHDDNDPSAFVVFSNNGQPGIHCMACKATFWPEDSDFYDFTAFDKIFEERRLNPPQLTDAEGLARFFPPEPTFEKFQKSFLPPITYEPGITLIKSPKGSGKTQSLISLLDDVRLDRYHEKVRTAEKVKSILLIGHRQALLREAAAKLDLRLYLDPHVQDGGFRTLAVCLDSLPKFNEPYVAGRDGVKLIWKRDAPFDLVIIDEIEQVLRHLLSKTLRARVGIERCFDALQYEVSRAKAVIGLDADLGLVSTHALRSLRPQDWTARCRIIVNEPIQPEERRVLQLYADRKALEQQLILAVRNGQRCFVTSNSKAFIDAAYKMIENEYGSHVRARKITSDNSRDPSEVHFITNIKTEFLKEQVLLCSPSLGTGIDITFPDGACKVDQVFGFFYPFVNTHTDIDQQLARVRNPGAVNVWISPSQFNFTSNIDIITDDLARAYFVPRAVRGRLENGMADYNSDDPLLMIAAHVTAEERASKNKLRDLFCSLREANGWSIERINTSSNVKSAFDKAKTMLFEERALALTHAPRLESPEFIELETKIASGINISDADRAAYEKNKFENLIGVPLTKELIDDNHDGRLIERILAFAEVLKIFQLDLLVLDEVLVRARDPSGRLSYMPPAHLRACLLISTGLATSQGFVPNHTLALSDLSNYARLCSENRTVIEEILGDQMRTDVGRNPVRQLNSLLKRLGLHVLEVRQKKVAGIKIRLYALDSDCFRTMVNLAQSYLSAQDRRHTEAAELRSLLGKAA